MGFGVFHTILLGGELRILHELFRLPYKALDYPTSALGTRVTHVFVMPFFHRLLLSYGYPHVSLLSLRGSVVEFRCFLLHFPKLGVA